MHKRVVFRNRVLPYLLVAPQMIITLVFFIWPAGQALFQSLLIQDAFGLSTRFVWFENFERLFADAYYLQAFRVTVIFSAATAGLALGSALLLAVMADRVIRGAVGYKTLLVGAVRDCSRRRRRALALHVQPDGGHHRVHPAGSRVHVEPPAQRATRPSCS